MNQPQHKMFLEKTHSSGAEEWNCPTCGRRLLISWEPKFTKTVLEVGDDFSIHSGGKGGLKIGGTQIIPVNNPNSEGKTTPPIEDPRLAPWEAWLEGSGFENLWNED
jgi:hypothetical protein